MIVFQVKWSEHIIDSTQLCVLAQSLHLLLLCWLWVVVGLALVPWLYCLHICLNSSLNSLLYSIVKDNKLRSRVMCQSGIMKLWNKSWMDVAGLFVASTISNKPVLCWWIYHCEYKQEHRECALDGVHIVNGPTRSIQIMIQGYSFIFCYFGW
jgi:hypothetical protein